jgi:hypothetical protein
MGTYCTGIKRTGTKRKGTYLPCTDFLSARKRKLRSLVHITFSKHCTFMYIVCTLSVCALAVLRRLPALAKRF